MNKQLNTGELYSLIRPLKNHFIDPFTSFPIIKKDNYSINEMPDLKLNGISTINSKYDKSRSILQLFSDDRKLEALYNNFNDKLYNFSSYYAVCTPDFSIYPSMNINKIKFNIYRNRDFGCALQEIGIKVIPTIQWMLSDSYSYCFSGVEKNSVVAVSTLGCLKHPEIFLNGFNEMKFQIDPELIIVYGKLIKGMHGKILHYYYEEAFFDDDRCIQTTIFPKKEILYIDSNNENDFCY